MDVAHFAHSCNLIIEGKPQIQDDTKTLVLEIVGYQQSAPAKVINLGLSFKFVPLAAPN